MITPGRDYSCTVPHFSFILKVCVRRSICYENCIIFCESVWFLQSSYMLCNKTVMWELVVCSVCSYKMWYQNYRDINCIDRGGINYNENYFKLKCKSIFRIFIKNDIICSTFAIGSNSLGIFFLSWFKVTLYKKNGTL